MLEKEQYILPALGDSSADVKKQYPEGRNLVVDPKYFEIEQLTEFKDYCEEHNTIFMLMCEENKANDLASSIGESLFAPTESECYDYIVLEELERDFLDTDE